MGPGFTGPCSVGYGNLFPAFVSSLMVDIAATLCLGPLVLVLVLVAVARGPGRLGFSMPFKVCKVWLRACVSSPRPMSSKLVMSDKMPSAPVKEEECQEDDLEDLDPVKPGGEPGASATRAFISSSAAITGSVKERQCEED